MLARAGRLLEAFEGALSGRVSKGQRDMSPPRDAKLRSEYVRVRLGRSWRDSQALGDLSVRASLSDELNHLELPGSELLFLGHGRKGCSQWRDRLPIAHLAYLERLHPPVYERGIVPTFVDRVRLAGT